MVVLIDRKYLRFFLFGQAEHGLNRIELIQVFFLIEQNPTVGVIYDGFTDDRRGYDVVDFLRNDDCLTEIFS